MPDLKNIKIMFIDIDGTLANDEKEITEYTKTIIEKATKKGIYTIITSGRTNDYAVEKSKIVKASNIVISNNGATIFDYKNDKKIYNSEFENSFLEKILNYVKDFEVECTFNSIYKRYRNSKLNILYAKDAISINKISDIDDAVSQIVFDSHNYEQIKLIQNFIKGLEEVEINNICETLQSDIKVTGENYWFDTALKGNSKGKAIEKLLKILKIDKKDSICFGDQINDYTMFESVGIKVAMENGMNELKEKADFIALSNNEDGVAKFIEENIL